MDKIIYCPKCGNPTHKNPKMAEGVRSCKLCGANHLIICTNANKKGN